jgi:predicted DNA-binding protein (MmcQ/YjbR family)
MNIEDYRAFCLSLEGAEEKMPFTKFKSGASILTFLVGGHIFCYVNIDDYRVIGLNFCPQRVDEINASYDCVSEPPLKRARYWVGVDVFKASDETLMSLTREAYEYVKAKHSTTPAGSTSSRRNNQHKTT